jgi:hypothetical protein
MNETQKKCVERWMKILLFTIIGIGLIVGMITNVVICGVIVILICSGFIGYLIVLVIAERIYLWRVMGVLTPEEWQTVKWYNYSLIGSGANWVAESLREDGQLEEAELFDRIEKNVKRPKIIS